MDLVIASNNKNKIKEIKAILNGKFEHIYSLSEQNINVEIEETGATFKQNALIKANAICKLCGLPTLADDSGLCVDALNNAPGVYSARYAGEPCNDANNNTLLLKNLQNCNNRKASFVSVVALVYPNGATYYGEGKIEGEILHEYRGDNGFGYDPLFYCYQLDKTFAEADGEQKNKVSHRAQALQNLLKQL
ncbi:MAG: XTP/dITP diphosphatase [Clostridia bacterium]